MRKLGILYSHVLAWLWNLTPWVFNVYCAKALAFLWIDVLKIRRQVIFDNLKTAFPKITPAEQKQIAKQSMIALCRSFFDVIRIPYLNDSWIDRNVVFEGENVIQKIKADGSGLFFMSLHLGSGDLAGAVVSRRIKPMTLITKRFKNQFLDGFWFGLRERSQTFFINAHDKSNAFQILGDLKSKRGVAFVLDQFMGMPYGVESQFFGVTTGTAYGLALFAKKTLKPVYPLYTYWGKDGKLHICVDEAVDLTDALSENNQVITNKFNNVLEKIITRHPDQWMWVHKRWKTFE